MSKHAFSRWCGCPDCMFGPGEPEPVELDDEPDDDPPLPPAGAAHPMTTDDLFRSYGRRVDDGYLADLEYERRKEERLYGDAA